MPFRVGDARVEPLFHLEQPRELTLLRRQTGATLSRHHSTSWTAKVLTGGRTPSLTAH
jgi:hypothetical protein